MEKEEKAIILDYLPYGYPMDKKMMPVAQAIGIKYLTPLQLIPRRGIKLEVKEEVYIGEGKRDKIYFIQGRLRYFQWRYTIEKMEPRNSAFTLRQGNTT